MSACSWIGPYLGANVGYEWGDGDQQSDQAVRHRRRHRGRLQLAARPIRLRRRNRHPAVRRASDTFAPWQFSNPWFGTVRGRAGVAVNNVLVFGTAGLAYGDLRVDSPAA